MSDDKVAVIERPGADLIGLAGVQIKTPQELAERIRQVQGQAHILSPMAAVAAIAPGYVVNPVVVAIDPSVDGESGRGAEVYFQAAIHKKDNQGKPVEVSLNKNGLMKILTASGANVYPTQRLDDTTRAYYWHMMAQGDVTDFDGRIRRLPPGSVEIDLRDGSPQIGGWTPEEWAERVKAAQAGMKPEDFWKAKPKAIGGWTAERVMNARKFGLRLAEAKALNALARNLGVRQVYTLRDLQKPFIIFRASFVPDQSDPEVRRMLTAAALGARTLMYGSPSRPQELATNGEGELQHGDVSQVVEAHAVEEPVKPLTTDAAPEDAQEVDFDAKPETATRYHVKTIRQGGEWFYVETAEGPVFVTQDRETARRMNEWRKTNAAFVVETEKIGIGGKTYGQILEVRLVGTLKL